MDIRGGKKGIWDHGGRGEHEKMKCRCEPGDGGEGMENWVEQRGVRRKERSDDLFSEESFCGSSEQNKATKDEKYNLY